MRRAPHERTNAAPLAGEGHQFLVAAPGTAQPQEAVGKDAVFSRKASNSSRFA
jgi:hypothetical protein